MNSFYTGKMVEERIIDEFNLQTDSNGFDGCDKGKIIEIKGCLPYHSNGINEKGEDRRCKGRFWIDNQKHLLLSRLKGEYIFVLYEWFNKELYFIGVRRIKAKHIQNMITEGDNSKIRYDRIFPEYTAIEDLCQ